MSSFYNKDLQRYINGFKRGTNFFTVQPKKDEVSAAPYEHVIYIGEESYFYKDKTDRDADFYLLNQQLSKLKRRTA